MPSDATPHATPWKLIAAALQGALYLAYPFVIYATRTRWPARGTGALLLALYTALFLLRLRGAGAELRALLLQHAAVPVLIAVAVALDNHTLLLLLPALVSLYLLGTFAATLRRGPSMIERFARMVEDDLPPFTHSYCRRVTWLWCLFLAANAAAMATLALAGPLRWWALYTGVIFYALLGVFIGAEFVVRKWWFRYYGSGPVDRLFARLFPAESTANGRRSLAYVARRRALAETAPS